MCVGSYTNPVLESFVMQKASQIVGRMDAKPVKLNASHQKAGVMQILSQNFDGSYACLIDLPKVDLNNTKANPRKHSPKHGGKIRNRWDLCCSTNPILRYSRKKLITVDGRHRSFELLAKNHTVVTANIHFNITVAQAAAIFHDLTRNAKRIGCWDAHSCGLTANFKWSNDIQDTLDEYGLTCPNSLGYNTRNCDVNCYDPLHEAWVAQNGTLDALCNLLVFCYVRDNTEIVEKAARLQPFLRGLIDLLQNKDYQEMSFRALAKALIRRTASQIDARASELADEQYLSRPNRQHYFLALSEVVEIPVHRKKAA